MRRNNGREQQIPTSHLVPGDVILLHMGDKVPADCRVIFSSNLKVNNAELTGESKAVKCTTIPTNENILESTNMVFYSSLIVEGNGEAIVVATGDQTVLGRVSKLTRSSNGDEITGLHREVNRFVLFVLCATVISIIVIWITWVAWLHPMYPDYIPFNANVVNSIGMIVGFLPVGLPSAVTLVLVIVAVGEVPGNESIVTSRFSRFSEIHVVATGPGEKSPNSGNVQLRIDDLHG